MKQEMAVGFAIKDGNFLFLKNGWHRIPDTKIFKIEREQMFSHEEIQRELKKFDQYELRIMQFSYMIKDAIFNGVCITEEPPYDTYEEIPEWLKINKGTPAAKSLSDFIKGLDDLLNSLEEPQLAWVQDIINDYIDRGMTYELHFLEETLKIRDIEKALATLQPNE